VGHSHRVNYQELKVKFTFLHILLISLPMVLQIAAPAVADGPLVQVLNTGRIDWSARTIKVRGFAAPDTIDDGESPVTPSDILDAARRMAQANLLETASTIPINADSRIADRMAQSTDFREGLISLTRNASLTHQEYLSDGTAEIELTMNLTGGFSQFVLPEEVRQVDSVFTMTAAELDADKPKAQAEGTDGGAYTGLIIDATDIGAKPSLVPLVVDESEAVVYGPAFVSREFAVARGMSGFATTLAAARSDKRVGARPLVVKAIRTPSARKTNLVVSSADGARLRSSVVHLNFLKACRVTIVMDPMVGP
jgi:hypothetical protein